MAAELAAGLGDIALFAAPGWALTELSPALRATPAPRRLAYAYAFGIAAVSGALWTASHLFNIALRGSVVWTVVALGLGIGAAAALRRRIRDGRPGPRPPGRPKTAVERTLIAAAVTFGAVVSIGLLADAISNPVTDWDGRMTWTAQARFLRAAATVDADVLQAPRWWITHPRYPILLPLAQVAAEDAWGASEDSHAFRALYAAFFPVFLLLVYDGAQRWAGPGAAALAALTAAALPVLSHGEGSAATTYSDLPLACFYGAALLLLLGRRRRLGDAVCAGLLLGGLVLAKNEGLPLAVAALGLGLLAPGLRWRRTAGRGRRLRRLAVATVPVLAALALLLSWQSGIPKRDDEDYWSLLTDATPAQALLEAPRHFLPVVAGRMAQWSDWRGFWWLAPLVLALGWRAFRRASIRRWTAAVLAPIAVAWIGYSVHWEPAAVARVTWNRTLLEAGIPLLIVVAAAAVEPLRSRARRRSAAEPLPGLTESR